MVEACEAMVSLVGTGAEWVEQRYLAASVFPREEADYR